MCNKRLRFCLLAGLFATLPATAQAYVDPGTTSLIVGGSLSLLAWAALALAFLRKQIFRFFKWSFRGMRAHPAASLLSLALVFALGLGGAYGFGWLGGEETSMSAQGIDEQGATRVLLIGIDGVDPDDLEQLMEADLLPHFKLLAEQGAFRRMGVPNPAQSPVVWSSLATGRNPGAHGVFDFIERDPATYLPRLTVLGREGSSQGAPVQSATLWQMVAGHGLPATVIRWPVTFPPEDLPPSVHLLGGLGVPDIKGGLGRYSFYTDKSDEGLQEVGGGGEVIQVAWDGDAIKSRISGPRARSLTGVKQLSLPMQIKAAADGRGALLQVGQRQHVLPLGRFSDWVEVEFGGVLSGKHRGMMRFYLESMKQPFALYATAVHLHPDAPVVAFSHPPDYAAELKSRIGPYHTLGMPEDTKALGNGHLSDAGFFAQCELVEKERRAMLLEALQHFDRGLLAVVFDTSDRIQHVTAHANDVSGTAIGRYLIEFDRFLGQVLRSMPENTALMIFSDHGFTDFAFAVDLNRWLLQEGYLALDEAAYAERKPGDQGELYKYVDWARTRAYAVGFSGLAVNMVGREGQGIVAAEDAPALGREIADKLKQLRHPEAGEDVVHQVYQAEKIYSGKCQDEATDLVVGFKPGYRGSWQSALGGLAEEVISPNDKRWQRDHIVDASFVQASLLSNFAMAGDSAFAYDIVPTVLDLLGLEIPASLEGRSLLRGGSGGQDLAARPSVEKDAPARAGS